MKTGTCRCTYFSDDTLHCDVPIDQLRLRVGAYAIILRGEGDDIEILMTRNHINGKLFPPGGGVEDDEREIACLLREVPEETGLELTFVAGWQTFEGFCYFDPGESAWHTLAFCYIGKVKDSTQPLSDGDPDEGRAEWVKLDRVHDRELQHIAKNIIAHVRRDLRHILSLMAAP